MDCTIYRINLPIDVRTTPTYQYIGITIIKLRPFGKQLIFIIQKNIWKDSLYIEMEPRMQKAIIIDCISYL